MQWDWNWDRTHPRSIGSRETIRDAGKNIGFGVPQIALLERKREGRLSMLADSCTTALVRAAVEGRFRPGFRTQ